MKHIWAKGNGNGVSCIFLIWLKAMAQSLITCNALSTAPPELGVPDMTETGLALQSGSAHRYYVG